jgi:hypothetical protein
MVEQLGGQYTAARRSYGGYSIELQNIYCLGKQLTSKQASKQRASKSGNRASRGVFCLLACLSASLDNSILNIASFSLDIYPYTLFSKNESII